MIPAAAMPQPTRATSKVSKSGMTAATAAIKAHPPRATVTIRSLPNRSPSGPKTSCIRQYANENARTTWPAVPAVMSKSRARRGKSPSGKRSVMPLKNEAAASKSTVARWLAACVAANAAARSGTSRWAGARPEGASGGRATNRQAIKPRILRTHVPVSAGPAPTVARQPFRARRTSRGRIISPRATCPPPGPAATPPPPRTHP
jgi:hypothetical protein